ncbi:MAG: PAS domain-containing protein [Steroidobacteraceae bacterium]
MAALRVLYEFASSPTTASKALALLHELQVHQVEVDLQEEELRRSRVELENALNRQIQLYDYAPVGHFVVDGNAALLELNRTGATLLGSEPDSLRGQSLEGFLTPEAVPSLRAMLARVAEGAATAFADLRLQSAPDGDPRCVHASACRDPDGGGFLVGVIAMSQMKATPAA